MSLPLQGKALLYRTDPASLLRYQLLIQRFCPDERIVNACVHNLTWTHFRSLLRVPDENARLWYMNETSNEGWSSRTLDRNISTQYFYRLMQSPKKNDVVNEMLLKNSENQKNQFELLKSPIVAEFFGFKNEDSYLENDLESAILTHIRDFLMEMGKGFAFVARQQHIVTETEDYYIDLVFYNIELKCYVLIDLKMGKITHQDVGQIDMYVRMYDDLKCKEGIIQRLEYYFVLKQMKILLDILSFMIMIDFLCLNT